MPLRPGDPRQLGKYRLLQRLGEGGMGSVYLADSAEGRTVALKVIRADLAVEPEFRRRFRSEVTRAQEVPPFCTAEVLDSDPDHETPYLVVEYVDGPSLSEVVLDRGPLTPANLYGLAIGVATALAAIHSAGVIHRDLKPSNVLLAPGSPKVIDFGIAQAASGTDGDTRTDQLIGTVSYMAPERLDPGSDAPLTPAADVFAWGAVLAFAATGRVPFLADSSPATAVAILTRPPDLDGIAEPLRSLIARALAKNPAHRPTARALLDELLARTPKGVLAAVAENSSENPIVAAAVGNLSTDVAAAALEVPPEFSAALRPSYVDASGGWSTTPVGRVGVPVAPTEAITPRRRRTGQIVRSLGVIVLVVIVLATAGAVAGFATGYLRLPGTANTSPPTDPPSSPASVSPDPSLPAFGTIVANDSLATQDRWTARVYPGVGSCAFVDSLLVATLDAVPPQGTPSLRCMGIADTLTDLKVSVDVTLRTADSCAGIWFHLTKVDRKIQGYAVQICSDGVEIGDNGVSDFARLHHQAFASPLQMGVPSRFTVIVVDDQILLYRDGVQLGSAWRPDEVAYTTGTMGIGVIQRDGDADTPYQVGFDHIEVDAP
jgi:serine/threonine protein kinase